MNNATISLAMIIRDVEKTLDRCLESFSQCVDEIIIVDTGSVDNSVEIAQKYTNKIYHFEWVDDFSAARNFSFEKCTEEIIYWCDGDDYILPADIKKIKEYDFTDKDMVICNYIYAHDGFGGKKSVVPRERFFRRSLGRKWGGAIHEVISLQGKYHVTDIETHHDKQHGTSERNLAILERIVKKDPSPRYLYYLGKEYIDFNRIDDAINNLLKFLENSGAFWEDAFQAHCKLANCYLIKKDEEKFIYHIFESIKMEDRQAEPFYFLGLYYMNKQNWQRAVRWFEVCLQMERPKDLLSPYQPEYFTWLPALNACVCYNSIGEMQKAYDCNQRVLKYRPKDPRAVNNEKILADALKREKGQKEGNSKKLNLGCGGKTMEGYTNVDIFKGPGVDEVFDLDEIPYLDNTISAINSEHSLEHVGWKRSEKALEEWFRVLEPGGELVLKMPDLEQCCREYIKQPIDTYNRLWYKYTIYGIQKSQGGEPDEAQYHTSGYSKQEIEIVLKRIGFIVNYAENYDGWSTPSVEVRAVKPGEKLEEVSKLKIGWINAENWNAAQVRIRVLRVNEWLGKREYDSHLLTYDEFLKQDYDIAVIGKSFSEYDYENIKKLKQEKKTVLCDLCEDILNLDFVNEILALCDKVICCSDTLAEKVKSINPNVITIEDAYETD